jgi:hypothetical protein
MISNSGLVTTVILKAVPETRNPPEAARYRHPWAGCALDNQPDQRSILSHIPHL